MFAFWILAASMALVAVAFVAVPLLRTPRKPGPSTQEVALDVLRGQRREIESDIAAGHLPADAREEALEELLDRAGEDLVQPAAKATPSAGRPWITVATTALAIPALAFGLYAALGTPSATDARLAEAMRTGKLDERQLATMIETLASKVRARPDDAQGWALLARSLSATGRFKESAEAYEHLDKLVPRNAQVLADWADSLAMAQGRSLKGRPLELLRRSLEIEPTNGKALALAATAAMDMGDNVAALALWQRLAASLPADSPDAEQVRGIITELRGQTLALGQMQAPPGPGPRVAQAPAASTGQSVSGTVAIDPALASSITGNETLFVFARSDGGPRVPLAVLRSNASTLPLAFTLDDTQAMAPGMNISSAKGLRVEARISRSGNATPQPGDLTGASDVVKPGARGVKVLVDKVMP